MAAAWQGAAPHYGGMARAPKLAFLFARPNMGHTLRETEPAFRQPLRQSLRRIPRRVTAVRAVCKPIAGDGAQLTDDTSPLIDDTTYTQTSTFVGICAGDALAEARGVQPDLLIGHGAWWPVWPAVFSLEDGLKLNGRSGQLMGPRAPHGMEPWRSCLPVKK